MNKLFSSFILLSVASLPSLAGNHVIEKFQLAGPVRLQRPVMIDSVDINGKAFDEQSLLSSPLTTDGGKTFSAGEKLQSSAPFSVASLSFDAQTTAYTKATLSVAGLKTSKIYVDGTETDGKDMTLEPGTHHFVISTLLKGSGAAKPKVTLSTDHDAALTVLQPGAKRLYTVKDVLNGTQLWGISLSHDGRYSIEGHLDTQDGGKTTTTWIVRDLDGNKIVRTSNSYLRFCPGSNDLLLDRTGDNGKRQIVRISIDNGSETVLADGLPKDDSWQMTPDGKSLILSHVTEGPKESKDIYQIVEPDDRQPGWRNRTSLLRYDLSTGVTQPLTFGYNNVSLLDISSDSRYILFLTARRRLTARPTTLCSIWRMDLQTLKPKCLVKDDGFIASAAFSPDGKQIAIEGSPECLGGIGKNLPDRAWRTTNFISSTSIRRRSSRSRRTLTLASTATCGQRQTVRYGSRRSTKTIATSTSVTPRQMSSHAFPIQKMLCSPSLLPTMVRKCCGMARAQATPTAFMPSTRQPESQRSSKT